MSNGCAILILLNQKLETRPILMRSNNTINPIHALHELEQIKPSEIWRLYIDGYRQLETDGIQKGSMLFDEGEPGYMNAMLNAHDYMIKTLHLPLTPQLIIDFHQLALKNVKNTANKKLGTFRNNCPGAFHLAMNDTPDTKNAGNVSIQGLYEFLIATDNKIQYEIILSNVDKGGNKFDDTILEQAKTLLNKSGMNAAIKFLRENILTRNINFYVPRMSHVDIQEKVLAFIADYKLKIIKSTTPDEKLEPIIFLIQQLVRLHPFEDGNCRTFAMLLLNRELALKQT